MLIVAGWMDVAEEDRDAFLASRLEAMLKTRDEPGCLDYVFSPDPTNPRRVRLFELWESRAHLDVHLGVMRARPASAQSIAVTERSVAVYETSTAESLG